MIKGDIHIGSPTMGKQTAWLAAFVMLMVSTLGTVASAQQEQWLQYRKAAEPYSYVGGTGGCEGILGDQAPSGVALPAFNADKPLFAFWRCPAGSSISSDGNAKGAWLALDCTSKGGRYDLLYIDSNLDGSLADEKPLKAPKTPPGYPRDYSISEFKLIKMILPWQTGETAYHLNVRFTDYRGQRRLSIESACWYEGPVIIDGKELWCTLLDTTCNGKFNEMAPAWSKADKIRLAPEGDRSFQSFETDRTTRNVGQYVEVEGKLHQLDVSPDGAYVKFSPAGDVPTGSCRVDPAIDEIFMLGSTGSFERSPKDGVFTLPVGEYRFQRWAKTKTDQQGARWRLLALQSGNPQSRDRAISTVTAGGETVLEFGGPPKSRVQAAVMGQPTGLTSQNAARRREFNLNQELEGALGERVVLQCNGAQVPAPKIRITNADGDYDKTFSMEYG
jgi:hypothetical protein